MKFYVFLKEIIRFRGPRGSRGHPRRARWAQICARWSAWGSKEGPSGARGGLRGSPWTPRGHFSGFLRAENRDSESRLRTPLAGVTILILVCALSLLCSPWWPASEHKCVRYVCRGGPGGPRWGTYLSPKSPVRGPVARLGAQI